MAYTHQELQAYYIPHWHEKSKSGLIGVIGYAAEIPCQVTPLSDTDAPHLILWYKDIFGTPIYSFDMRKDLSGRHWMDTRILGNRASFHIEKTDFKTRNGTSIYKSFLRIDNTFVQKSRKSDAGPYRCRVDFKEAPTRNVKVKLSLIGDPLPELQWWRLEPVERAGSLRGQEVESSKMQLKGEPTRIEGNLVRRTLKLERLQRQDFGLVLGCSATNTDLVPSPQTMLKINMLLPPIRAKIEREWSYFLAGKTYNISCQIQGSNPAAYAKVKIGNRELKLLDDQNESEVQGRKSTIRVVFVPTVDDHDEFLSCRGENPHLTTNNAVEDQWKITVQYVPKVTLNLVDYPAQKVELNENDNLEMKCVIDANPKAHVVHWRKDGIALNGGPGLTMRNVMMESERQSSSILLLEDVQADKTTGNYTCVGENLLGRGSSNPLEVRVKYPPKCARSGSLLHYVRVGQKVDLPCVVGAFPLENIQFEWSFYHVHDKNLNKEAIWTRSPGANDPLQNNLQYQPNSTKDYGTLHCRASNVAGRQVTPCIFEIKPKGAPKVEDCEVVATGLKWVRLQCLIDSPYEPLLPEGHGYGTRVKFLVVNSENESLKFYYLRTNGVNCRITAFEENSPDINSNKLGKDGRPLVAPPETGVEIESFVLTSVQSSALEHTGLRDLRRADVTLSGLSSGSRYRLQVTAFNSLSEAEARERLTSNEPQMFEIAVTTLTEPDPIILRKKVEENANGIPPIADDISNVVSSDTNRRPWSAEDNSLPPDEVMVVEVEASSMPSKIMKPPRGPRPNEKSDQPLLIPINDPIRLLPIIGVLAIVVIVLILIAVMIVVIMRSRNYNAGDPSAKTHVGFNRSLDFDIDGDQDGDENSVDKAIRKNLESLAKVDSYEQLNNVRFEGFSSLERRRSNTNSSSTSSSNHNHPTSPNRKSNLLIEVTPKSSTTSSYSDRRRSQSLLESDLDFDPRRSLTKAYVHSTEVPVGPLCIIEDDFSESRPDLEENASTSKTEDHFPFREAIQAPTAVSRIEQLTILTTQVLHSPPKKEVTFAPLVQEMEPDDLNLLHSEYSSGDSTSKSEEGTISSSSSHTTEAANPSGSSSSSSSLVSSTSQSSKVDGKKKSQQTLDLKRRSSDSTLESECLI
ncbi:hypothetical protein TCAL_04736 [Tigriopus californicus]|uniref:Ig-like domain-containing protein n=1 Tax=Tigriopus californicus TaxID=6832 RepID=A0A553P1U6_TIGCA|nr:hypothetical protein TCAL_04736 [Tigriopus californicus]|eukprot:TCALIF_04736-PA protein Name:"Similar to Dscaml1 Down syndrome cell adhesion molecule-like protein 1 homolog (Mus musculus)" AED:0.10 eAED:0.09 QI:0/0.70/0.61/0.94/0.82/0.88/18/104/1136